MPPVNLRFQKSSLVEQVADALRREIAAGTCRGWLPTERALCEQLRVSRRTLRCALEQLKQRGLVTAHVGVGTKVAAPAAPGPAARANPAPSVGLLVPEPIDVLRPYVTLWIDLLKTELFASGIALGVHAGTHYFQRGSGPALRRLIEQQPHACWILTLSNAWLQQWFHDNRITAMVAGMPAPGIALPSVALDSGALGRHIAGRMLALGHRRLVMLSATRPSPGAAAAEEAFLRQIRNWAAGDAHGAVLRPEPSPASYRRAVERLLRIQPRVTAMLALNPLFGATVVTTLMHHGLRLPDDISFATTYGDPFMRFLSPEPTRYAYQPALFARKLSRTVRQIVRGEEPTVRQARIIPSFVKGETLGPAPGRAEPL